MRYVGRMKDATPIQICNLLICYVAGFRGISILPKSQAQARSSEQAAECWEVAKSRRSGACPGATSRTWDAGCSKIGFVATTSTHTKSPRLRRKTASAPTQTECMTGANATRHGIRMHGQPWYPDAWLGNCCGSSTTSDRVAIASSCVGSLCSCRELGHTYCFVRVIGVCIEPPSR